MVADAHNQWRQEMLAGIGRPLVRAPLTEEERKVRREDASDDDTEQIETRDNYTRSVVASADESYRDAMEDESLFQTLVLWAYNRFRRQGLAVPSLDDDSSGSEEIQNYL